MNIFENNNTNGGKHGMSMICQRDYLRLTPVEYHKDNYYKAAC